MKRHLLTLALLLVLSSAARAESWVFQNSYYSHNPTTQVRIGRQYLEAVEVLLDGALQPGNVAATCADHFDHGCVVQQRVEHVLDADELVPPSVRLANRESERLLERTTEMHYASSIVTISGYS